MEYEMPRQQEKSKARKVVKKNHKKQGQRGGGPHLGFTPAWQK